ncbi:MAG TPA: EamA family transporter [Myxococcales bacterium]|nr:EamA family transporter [Myxococcales bacterium]
MPAECTAPMWIVNPKDCLGRSCLESQSIKTSVKDVSFVHLLIVLCAGITAISASAILIRVTKAPSLSIAFWRVTISALVLLPLWLSPARRRALKDLSLTQRWQLLASGICLGVHFWAWITSLAYTSVAASVLLVTTNPLWVGLLSPWLVGERLAWRTWLGIGLAMLGAAIVAFGDTGGGQSAPLLGNALALLGAFAASGFLLFGRNVRVALDVWSYASAQLMGAWCVLAIGMLATSSPFVGFQWSDWGLFLSMALLPQLVGHNSSSWSLRYLRADTVSVILLLEPIGAALLALLFLAEWPGMSTFVGGLCLLVGVIVVLRRSQ